MNSQTATTRHIQHLIASPVHRPQAPRLIHLLRTTQSPERTYRYAIPRGDLQVGRVADSEADEETLRDLASQTTLRNPELYCLLAVAPEELQAIVDGFLS